MLIGVLVGAVLGLLGGLLGEGLSRFLKNVSGSDEAPKWPRIVGVALAISIFLKPTIAYINRPTPDAVMRDLEGKEPIYLTLKQKAPDVYARIKSDIEESLANDDNAATIRTKIQKEIKTVYSQKIPQSSDTSLLTMVGVVRDEARSLNATNPNLCVAMLSEQGGDVSSALPDDLKQRESALLTQIVTEPPENSVAKASDADAKVFIVESALNISKKLNAPVQDVVAAMQGKGSDHLRCQVSSELMDAFTKLPAPAAGPMIRAVMFSK